MPASGIESSKPQATPVRKRPCQWCGDDYESAHPSKLYCSDQCKAAMASFVTVVGKRIAAVAMKWRAARGGAKNGGSAALKELCFLLDAANEEFRNVRPKNAPSIHDYYAARNKPNGIITARR